MSRSRRKYAIVKDKTGHTWYNRKIRRCQKQQVRDIKNLQDVLDYKISHPKELVNDYDVCDYIIDYEHLSPFWRKLGSNEGYRSKVLRK